MGQSEGTLRGIAPFNGTQKGDRQKAVAKKLLLNDARTADFFDPLGKAPQPAGKLGGAGRFGARAAHLIRIGWSFP